MTGALTVLDEAGQKKLLLVWSQKDDCAKLLWSVIFGPHLIFLLGLAVEMAKDWQGLRNILEVFSLWK